jgi:hypothetical protein
MAEKSGKKKTKKPAKAETGVLGNLPATRPSRLGGDRRGAAPARSSRPAAATKSSRPAAATKSSRPAAKPKPATKPKVRTPAGTAPKPPAAPPAGWQTPGEDGRKGGRPGGTEIVSTAVQAAGEIAQIGLTVGGQLLKRAAGRIPRP